MRARILIMDAFREILSEQPYDTVKVKAIVSRSSVTKATFYNNFKSKQDLLLLLCKERLDASLQTLYEEGWDAFILGCFTLGKENGSLLSDLGNATDSFWDFIQIYFSSLLKNIRATCTAQTEIAETDHMLIETYINAAIFLFRRWGIADPPASLESITELLSTYLPDDFIANADFSSLPKSGKRKAL